MEEYAAHRPLDQQAAPHTGTTILAVAFDGGVVIGADSRVSTGTYVSNRASDKITPLTDSVWLLRSGSAADTQLVADHVRHYTHQLTLELGREPDVYTVAKLVMQMNYSNKWLIGAMIVGGWDSKLGGQVYGCPIGGTLVRENWTTDGSGSTYIWGHLDASYREGMSQAETEHLVLEAVSLAIARDGSSGGVARLVTITEAGVKRRLVMPHEMPQMWDEIQPGSAVGMVI